MSPNEADWPWSELDLDGKPDDKRDVRRAYARKLKSIDADTEIEAFEKLRQAYEVAQSICGKKPRNLHNKFANSGVMVQLDQPSQQPPITAQITQPASYEMVEPEPDEPPADEIPAKTVSPWDQNNQFENLDDVIARAQELIKNKNLNPATWQPLFQANALDDPHSAQIFERGLADILTRLHTDSHITSFNRGFVDLIEQRFGWISDGIAFLNRYPNAQNVQALMANTIRGSTRPVDTDPRGKPIPPLVWVVPFIIWLFMLQYLY